MTVSIHGVEDFFPTSRRRAIRTAMKRVVQAAALRAEAEVAVALLGDDEIRELNRTYRGKDSATDVLSFATDADDAFMPEGMMDDALGDIAIAFETARRQASEYGHTVHDEICALTAHGLAHLLGFDHERGLNDARDQAEFELMLLDTAGLDPSLALVGRSLSSAPS